MPDKPSYLGLLNAIAVAESNAHEYLQAWIAVTPSAEVGAVLRTVAAREGEHGMAFAKRLDELGFQVRRKDDPGRAKRLEIAGSACSDLEKMKALRLDRLDSGDEPDIFDGFFADHTIDIRTGELLGRYIAEERDTARLLRVLRAVEEGRQEDRQEGRQEETRQSGEDRQGRQGTEDGQARRARGDSELGLSSPAVRRFEDQRAIVVGEIDRQRERDRLGAHLRERLAHHVDHLRTVESQSQVVQLRLDEHEAQHVFEELRLRVGSEVALRNDALHPLDRRLVVTDRMQDLGDLVGVEPMQCPPPTQVSGAPGRIRRTGNHPAADVMRAHREQRSFARFGSEPANPLGRQLGVRELLRSQLAPNHDLVGIVGVRVVDRGHGPGEALVVHTRRLWAAQAKGLAKERPRF